MRSLLRAVSALALLATPAWAGQQQYPTDLPALALSSRTVLDTGSNGELRFTGLPHAMTLAQGVPAAGGSRERFPEPVWAEVPSTTRMVPAALRRNALDGLPGDRTSAMAGR